MKFLRNLFDRADKKREMDKLNHELQVSIKRIEKNKEQQELLQQSTMDGEDGWFYKVCVDPQIINKIEEKRDGTISNDAVSSMGT